MNLIQQIAAMRRRLLDVLEENEGDINLQIFEDFYPDEAHFIFELLQNAEDAGATEVNFELTAHGCAVEHNGTRHFNEQDIHSITGIFNSSKKNSADKIGKFGVGFKSVFVYTDSPIIYSKQHSFKIVKLVLPQEVSPKQNLGERTRFEFPFNNPKKNVKEAYEEIKSGLKQLSENTLLFLKNIGYIKWRIDSKEGALLREEHSENHIEVLKQLDGKEVLSSHWLRFSAPVQLDKAFSAPVDGVERQQVSIAFELAFTGDRKSFDNSKAIKEQLKIASAVRGKVSVFFPADKETSGLRFHLHGPFIPELSRASIKNSAENLPLFGQLASLSANTLHSIKTLGLLSGEFLSVLPNNDDPLPERYQCIRKAILNEMKVSPLVPTHRGDYAPATRLLKSSASLKALLTTDDLAFVTDREDRPEWAIGAMQGSNQERLLSSLGLRVWDAGQLQTFLEHRARDGDGYRDTSELSQAVLDWLQSKPEEWLQALYAVLLKHCEVVDDFGKLDQVHFVRLTSGEWSTAAASFFQTGASSHAQRCDSVDEKIFSSGTKKQQQQDARKFLTELGVRVPNEADAMAQLLADSYRNGSTPPSDADYRQHLEAMISFLERNPHKKNQFDWARVFKVASLAVSWASARDVFLDDPYGNSGLSILYSLVTDQQRKRWPLDSWYLKCGIALERVIRFAELLGCQHEVDNLVVEACCTRNPNWHYLVQAPGGRAGNGINRDYALSQEAQLLLKKKGIEEIQLLWRALRRSETSRPTILRACYQYTEKGGPRDSPSQLVCVLRDLAWVPQIDGTFVKPKDAIGARLPKGFSFDSGHKWLQEIGFGSAEAKRAVETVARSARRSELGFKSEEDLQRALEFVNKISPDEQARILAEATAPKPDPVELPERPVRNPDIRVLRVGDDARSTPTKEAEIRERSVPLGAAEAIAAAKAYLKDQYTNSNDQMICQICRDELPFRLPSGSYYFEAIELVSEAKKRHRATYLALCPNHAAAYRYANAQRHSMAELVATASSKEIDIALGGVETTIYFTQTHLADARACIDADESE